MQCAGVLAKALKGAWRPYAKDLIEPMAMTGLTDTLVRALKVRAHLSRCSSLTVLVPRLAGRKRVSMVPP